VIGSQELESRSQEVVGVSAKREWANGRMGETAKRRNGQTGERAKRGVRDIIEPLACSVGAKSL
jgi:hypothetical protein